MAMQALKTYLFKTLGVQEGEIGKTLLMSINIFLIICATLIVKPIANGLFLAKFGVEMLPIAFLLVAFVAGGVSYLYTKVLQRYSVVRIFRLTFILSIIFLLGFGIALRLNIFEGLILYLLYIWIAIFALVATSQFWIIANFVFNVREAKRLFGLLGAGAIAGAIFGGYLTSILANFLSSEYLLFLCAGFLMASIPITQRVWKEHVVGVRSLFEQKVQTEFVSSHPFLLIRKSRHLSYMAAIAFVGVLVAKLVDYQFSGLAVASIDDPDELTAFFGFWFSTFNVISLLLQIFITRKVVGTFGVGTSLFFLPAFIFFAATLLLVFPELLFAAVFLKMTDASLKQSVNKAAMELIILPIPAQIKNQTKTFIDVFVDSIATGCTGLLLIFIIRGLDLPAWVVTVMVLLFGILWLHLAQKVRQEYVKTFSRKIEEAVGLHAKRSKDPFDFSKASVLDGLRKVLRTGSESQIVFVLRKLRELKEGRLYQEVVDLLGHTSEQVQVEAIRFLGVFHRKPVNTRERIELLMYSGGQEVKIEAFEYLLSLDYDNRDAIMKQYLSDADYRVRIAAMVSLARKSRTNPELKHVFRLEALIKERYGKLEGVTDPVELNTRLQGLLLAMGYSRIPEFFPVISEHLQHGNPEIYQHACLAAGKTADPFFVPELMRCLADAKKRSAAADALTKYGTGIISFLKESMGDPKTPPHVLKVLPAIAATIPSRESLELCFELLAHENQEIRHEAIHALTALKQIYPDYKVDRNRTINEIRKEARLYQDTLSILYTQLLASERETEISPDENSPAHQARHKLITLLEKKLDVDLETIFQLLGLHYASSEMASVYQVLRTNPHESRTDALEFLENLMEPHLKKVVMPILETAMWESITEEAIRKLKIRIPDEYQCFKMLLEGHHRQLKLAVLQLFQHIQNTEYLPLVDEVTRDTDARLQEYAKKTLEYMQGNMLK